DGEGSSVLSGTLSCTTTVTTNSPVVLGGYPITCSGQSAANYSINYVAGTLKILYAAVGPCSADVGHQILQPINADGTSVWKQGTPGVVTTFTLYQISANTVSPVDESLISTSTVPAKFRVRRNRSFRFCSRLSQCVSE